MTCSGPMPVAAILVSGAGKLKDDAGADWCSAYSLATPSRTNTKQSDSSCQGVTHVQIPAIVLDSRFTRGAASLDAPGFLCCWFEQPSSHTDVALYVCPGVLAHTLSHFAKSPCM